MDIVSKINDAMQNLTTQIAKKTQLNVVFKEQVGSKISAINTLIADIKDKMSNFSKTQVEVKRLSTQIQQLTDENTSLKEEIARLGKLAEKHGATQAELIQAEQQKSALEKQVKDNNDVLKTTEDQKQALQASLESIFEQLDANIGKLEDLTPDTNIISQLEEIRKELATLSGTPPAAGDDTSTSTPPTTPIDKNPPSNPPAARDDPVLNKHKIRALGLISTKKKQKAFKKLSNQAVDNAINKVRNANTHAEIKQATNELGLTKELGNLHMEYTKQGGKTRRHRKRRVSKRKTLKRKKLKGGYTADFEKKNKELRDKMRKRSKRHHSLRRPSSSTRKLSTSSKSSRRYKRSH